MSRRIRHSGVALVWTLLIVVVLAFIVLGLLTFTASQSRRARGGSAEVLTESLVDAARAEVLGKLEDAFAEQLPVGDGDIRRASVTASPGLLEVLRYDVPLNRGRELGAAAFGEDAFFRKPFARQYSQQPANPRWIPLYSTSLFAPQLKFLSFAKGAGGEPNPDFDPAAAFDINTARNPWWPGRHYLSGAGYDIDAPVLAEDEDGAFATASTRDKYAMQAGQTAAERPVWVQWIPVLEHASKEPGEKNRMTGRYAYWVDVENTKIRLDRASRALRESDLFAGFVGESDGERGGKGNYFELGAENPFRRARQSAEGLLPHYKAYTRKSLDGTAGPGFPSGIGANVRDAWLSWRGEQRPAVADTSLVDWDYFTALRPWLKTRAGSRMALDDVLSQHAQAVASDKTSRFLQPLHALSLLDPRVRSDNPESGDALLDFARQFILQSATSWGWEEEVDPLGRTRIDLNQWARSVGGCGGHVNIDAIRRSELFKRLKDPAYYNAYFPGGWPTGGSARSFAKGFNRFAGDGDPGNDANGEAAVVQMLVNVAEATQPPSSPPLIDADLGIVGARSMPYVAEVATRARSALWSVSAAERAKLLEEGEANPGMLRQLATSVEIELIFGLLNPDPFNTDNFNGQLEVDYEWVGLPQGVYLPSGTLRADLRDKFSAAPTAEKYAGLGDSGKNPRRIRIVGNAAYFKLGVVPGEVLKQPAPLRIKGWRILRNGAVWHQVPIRNPGGGEPREWWAMAQSGLNAGSPWNEAWDSVATTDKSAARSLAAYQSKPAEFGYRAVGWFTEHSLSGLAPDSLFIADWDAAAQSPNGIAERLVRWRRDWEVTALLERVSCTDPVLGHRTGDSNLGGLFGRGQFYGALGHPWRWFPVKEDRFQNPLPNQTMREEKEIQIQAVDYTSAGNAQTSVPGLRAHGVFRENAMHTARWTKWNAAPGETFRGRYTTHRWLYPTQNQIEPPGVPDSPCGVYLAPSIEGSAPLGDYEGNRSIDREIEAGPPPSGKKIVAIDVETTLAPLKSDVNKPYDIKKGPLSVFAGAPPQRPFVSAGEIGLVHSGFPNRPITLGPDEGRHIYQLNSPKNGPPMRMLLDLLAAPRFQNEESDELSTHTDWVSGYGPRAESRRPRRGVWNVNTAIAHDGYAVLREGGKSDLEPRTSADPARSAARVIWMPSVHAPIRRVSGAEHFRGKDLKQFFELGKNPGHVLDRHLSPTAAFPRPWQMWLGLVSGDASYTRTGAVSPWGAFNTLSDHFEPPDMTWRGTRGLSGTTSGYGIGYLNMDPNSPDGAQLLTLGTDARKDDKQEGDGLLKGRWAADQGLALIDPLQPLYLPSETAARFSLIPMRHYVSDLTREFHAIAEWKDARTPLNPRLGSHAPPLLSGEKLDPNAMALLDGNAFPGGYHSSGIFYNAPLALLTNQAGTSATAFTIHVVAQAIDDSGKKVENVDRSGPGHHDVDDVVLSERWARITIERIPPQTEGDHRVRFRVVAFEQAGH